MKERKKVMDMALPTRVELLYIVRKINETNSSDPIRDRALIVLEYLTGCRISELLLLTRVQIETREIEGTTFLTFNRMRVLKRRHDAWRTAIIPMEKEKDLCEIAMEHINRCNPEDRLFPITRQRAWQIIDKHTDLFNHFFRHMRATSLTVEYQFSAQELRKFFGWATSTMADRYSHLQVTDIAKKMSI